MDRKILVGRTLIFLTILGLLLYWWQIHRLPSEEETPYGLFTQAQILERTEPLCPLVWPQYDRVTLTAEKRMAPTPEATGRVWEIDCETLEGRSLGHFCWSADTGDLLQLGTAHTFDRRLPPLKKNDLIWFSRQWLQKLLPQRAGERWLKVLEEAQEHTLQVRWKSQYRQADIFVEVTTGQLMNLRATAGLRHGS